MRTVSGLRASCIGPMSMPTIPAAAGPTRAMAASRTMLVNDSVTRPESTSTDPNHHASTASSNTTQKVASISRPSTRIAAAVRLTPTTATQPT